MISKDFEWYVNADLSEYKGEYVIVLNEKVVYHGKDLNKLLGGFREKHPGAVPKIAKVPEEETLVLGC